MGPLVVDFAGVQREFLLPTGALIDLEVACDAPVAVIFKRFGMTEYYVNDVKQVLLRGLVGGGMAFADAEKLVRGQMEFQPMLQLAALATDVIMASMAGIEADETAPADDGGEKMDVGRIFHSFAQLGITPDQVRAMRYPDFVAMMRAAGGTSVQPPSEAEFADMVREWESGKGG